MVSALANLEALAASGQLIAYVGYGSLVNVHTHRTPSMGYVPVKLKGWARIWCARGDEAAAQPAFLSGIEDDTSQIDALLVYDHIDSLISLDAREHGYDRLALDRCSIEASQPLLDCPTYIYRAQNLQPADPAQCHLLQSYVDAVWQGHEAQFGGHAVEQFIATTQNWALPLVRDRKAPLYPRPVPVNADDASRFDAMIASLVHS